MITENYKNRLVELAGLKQSKEIIFLIGLPGSGKSTTIKALQQKNPQKNYVVVSIDDVLEKLGAEFGLGYNDAYDKIDFIGKTFPTYIKEFKKHLKNGRNIIVDNTNMKRSDRVRDLGMVPNEYKKIALIFEVDPSELKKRLEKRALKTGKTIPDEAIEAMKNYYIPPTKAEGFNKILKV